MLDFYDGHLVVAQTRDGVVIVFVPSEDGMKKLLAHPDLAVALVSASVCGKSFQYQSDNDGCRYVCQPDDLCHWKLDLELRDIEEMLREEHDLKLRVLDKRYCRPITAYQ